MMLPNKRTSSSQTPMPRALRQQRERDAEQSVEAKFFQHAGVQHRGRRRARRRRLPAPRCGTERARSGCRSRSGAEGRCDVCASRWNAGPRPPRPGGREDQKCAPRGHAAIKQDQAEEQNETAEREIDRDLPGRGEAIARAPDADEQKGRNERELVKGVEEEQIERSERADRAAPR